MEAFVYQWTNKKNGKHYIGSHKGTIDDGYICSSKPMMEDYIKNPDSFKRKILLYGKHEYIVEIEYKLLKAYDAARNPIFYNQSNGNCDFLLYNRKGNKHALGYRHTPEALKKISESSKGRPSPKKGKPISEETRRKLSEAFKGRPSPKKGIKTGPISMEIREKMREAALLREEKKRLGGYKSW